MNLIKKNVDDLKYAEYNPRKKLTPDDREYQKIKKSIEEFGYVDPIIINKDNTIIGGHQRLTVLKDLGYKEVDVIQIDIDKTKEKALNIALNKITGSWDYAMLGDLLLDLDAQNYDLEITGFDLDEIENIIAPLGLEEEKEVIEDDFDCTPPEEPKSKYGDIYQLGNHYLMCGDSTKEEDVVKLMDGNKADVVFTDPPYGMNLDTDYTKMDNDSNIEFKQIKNITGGKKYNEIIGDNEDFKDELVTTIFKNFDYCKEIFVWGADYYPELLKDYKEGNFIIWDKRDDNEQFDKIFGSQFEVCWSKNRHKKEIARVRWCGVFGTEKEFDKKRVHPTQKPTELSRWFINKYSDEGNLIVDIYGGSGSTLIACEQLNRKCYMMELDPKYVDVIINRWETFTGKKAVLLNDSGSN